MTSSSPSLPLWKLYLHHCTSSPSPSLRCHPSTPPPPSVSKIGTGSSRSIRQSKFTRKLRSSSIPESNGLRASMHTTSVQPFLWVEKPALGVKQQIVEECRKLMEFTIKSLLTNDYEGLNVLSSGPEVIDMDPQHPEIESKIQPLGEKSLYRPVIQSVFFPPGNDTSSSSSFLHVAGTQVISPRSRAQGSELSAATVPGSTDEDVTLSSERVSIDGKGAENRQLSVLASAQTTDTENLSCLESTRRHPSLRAAILEWWDEMPKQGVSSLASIKKSTYFDVFGTIFRLFCPNIDASLLHRWLAVLWQIDASVGSLYRAHSHESSGFPRANLLSLPATEYLGFSAFYQCIVEFTEMWMDTHPPLVEEMIEFLDLLRGPALHAFRQEHRRRQEVRRVFDMRPRPAGGFKASISTSPAGHNLNELYPPTVRVQFSENGVNNAPTARVGEPDLRSSHISQPSLIVPHLNLSNIATRTSSNKTSSARTLTSRRNSSTRESKDQLGTSRASDVLSMLHLSPGEIVRSARSSVHTRPVSIAEKVFLEKKLPGSSCRNLLPREKEPLLLKLDEKSDSTLEKEIFERYAHHFALPPIHPMNVALSVNDSKSVNPESQQSSSRLSSTLISDHPEVVSYIPSRFGESDETSNATNDRSHHGILPSDRPDPANSSNGLLSTEEILCLLPHTARLSYFGEIELDKKNKNASNNSDSLLTQRTLSDSSPHSHTEGASQEMPLLGLPDSVSAPATDIRVPDPRRSMRLFHSGSVGRLHDGSSRIAAAAINHSHRAEENALKSELSNIAGEERGSLSSRNRSGSRLELVAPGVLTRAASLSPSAACWSQYSSSMREDAPGSQSVSAIDEKGMDYPVDIIHDEFCDLYSGPIPVTFRESQASSHVSDRGPAESSVDLVPLFRSASVASNRFRSHSLSSEGFLHDKPPPSSSRLSPRNHIFERNQNFSSYCSSSGPRRPLPFRRRNGSPAVSSSEGHNGILVSSPDNPLMASPRLIRGRSVSTLQYRRPPSMLELAPSGTESTITSLPILEVEPLEGSAPDKSPILRSNSRAAIRVPLVDSISRQGTEHGIHAAPSFHCRSSNGERLAINQDVESRRSSGLGPEDNDTNLDSSRLRQVLFCFFFYFFFLFCTRDVSGSTLALSHIFRLLKVESSQKMNMNDEKRREWEK